MIGRLTGRLLEQEADGTVVLDVAGVGYEVTVPLGALGRAGGADGIVTLHVHTHVREDALELFGFATPLDRTVFRTLLGVSHVGPKLALAVLGALEVEALAAAVEREDVGTLKRIPGVGLKTAQRIALELKGKLSGVPLAASPPRRPPPTSTSGGVDAQLLDALVRMGWKPAEAERAIGALTDRTRPLGELVRDALAILAR